MQSEQQRNENYVNDNTKTRYHVVAKLQIIIIEY